MVENLISLSEFFSALDELPWNYALYLPKSSVWHADMTCMVLNPEDSEDPDNPDDDPILAKKNNMRYLLMVQDVVSIVDNAKLQLDSVTQDELIQALKYYFDNDAYINF